MIDPQQKQLCEFIRITTDDGLELHGLLFEPKEKTNKALLHIHGWTGNFYEDLFIDYIAKQAVSKGYAFLTFNNRGSGIIKDFINKNNHRKYKRIGGSSERFEDCIIDIKAAINLLGRRGYQNIILDGHSTGCQKSTFYQYKIQDKRIKGLILIAPVDDVGFCKKDLKNKYQDVLKTVKKLIKKKGEKGLVPERMAYSPMMTAGTFLNVADSDSLSGKIFDYSGQLQEIKKVNCPVLAIFGSEDEYETDPIDKLKVLKDDVENCDTELIRGSNHGFVGYEKELSEIVGNWLKDRGL